jgi:hypothetical protein
MARFTWTQRAALIMILLLSVGARAQDSLNVTRLSQLYNNWAIAEAVKIDGDYLYVAANWDGLRVYNVSDRAHPLELGGLYLNGNCSGIDIAGGIAYVCVGTRLACVDITNRPSPQLLGTANTPGAAHDVKYRAGYAYVADALGGLRIVDVSDPAAPVVVGSATTRNEAFGIDLAGDYAFVADYESGLSIYNIADETQPQWVGETDDNPGFTDVVVHDNVAFAAAQDGLHLFNVSDPADPHVIGVYADAQFAQALALRWPLVFVDCHYHGLYALDCTDPNAPSVFGYLEAVSFEAWGVDCDSAYAYLAAGYSGARIVAASEPNSIWEAGFADTDYLQTTTLVDHYGYVAAGEYGFDIADLADPRQPVAVGALTIPGLTINAVAVGTRLYTASFFSISVIDVSSPAAPVVVNTIPTQDVIWWVEHAGNYLYVASGFGGLHTWDLTDPDFPVDLSGVGANYQLWSVVLSGQYAYGTAGLDGLMVYALSDPAAPIQIRQFDLGGEALFAAVNGERAYVTVADRGIAVVNVADPANPLLIRRFATRGSAGEVHVANGLLYVADQYTGLSIYSLWNRDQPQLVAYYDTPTNCVGLTIADTLVYVADWLHWGIYAHAANLSAPPPVAPELPRSVELRACYPNPFNARLRIEYSIPVTTDVHLSLYDVLGREVAVLVDGRVSAGRQSASFDGSATASGVYFVRLDADGVRAARKVCLLK